MLDTLFLVGVLVLNQGANPQTDSPVKQEAQRVFAQVSESVFLVEMVDDKGATVATGTAFLIGPKSLLTNAHVVADGECRLRVGPARIKCSVARSDSAHDLAELVIDSELVAKMLKLEVNPVPAGSTVYVVSNALGMERTISQGLVSASRKVDGQELIQLSAAISPGSSGGPVVGSAGEVVGVVVGSRIDGQLVNFAIPAKTARAFLDGTLTLDSFASIVARISDLSDAQSAMQYSSDPESPYGKNAAQITTLVRRAASLATEVAEYLKVVELSQWRDRPLAIEAAHKAAAGVRPPKDALLKLSELLVAAAEAEGTGASEKARSLAEAEVVSQKALNSYGSSEDTLYGLSEVQRARGQASLAIATLKKASAVENGKSDRVIESLARLTASSGQLVESEKWLDTLIERDSVAGFTYWLLGDFYEPISPKLAAKSYDRGAALSKGAFSVGLWTDAAEQWLAANAEDEALGSARAAIDAGKGLGTVSKQLSYAHRVVSMVLLDRGLKEVALTEARLAVDLNRDSGLANWAFASALAKNDRKLEAIDAFKSALRLTDGKHAEMHFELAAVYFQLERWADAQSSYEIASRLAPNDPSTTYNVAICLYNLGKKTDALPWLEETLRRSPSASLRVKTEQLIKQIR